MLREAEAQVAQRKQALEDAEAVVRYCRERLRSLEHQPLALPFERPLGSSLTGKTVAEATCEVLRAAQGRPLRVGEIARALVAGGFPSKKSLTVTITTAIRRREDLFERVDRGLFVLRNGEGGMK